MDWLADRGLAPPWIMHLPDGTTACHSNLTVSLHTTSRCTSITANDRTDEIADNRAALHSAGCESHKSATATALRQSSGGRPFIRRSVGRPPPKASRATLRPPSELS
ncbi:hypothetical protein DPSP01_013275 [Paraphaeosphaeria sporulosa]